MFGLPKSSKPREVPLCQEAIDALAAYRHTRGPLVFCDAAGSVLSDGKLQAPLKRALKRAGLREIGWHVLRHTVASHLVMRGAPLKVVQEILGHASITTTMIYAHLSPRVAREAVRLLDRPTPSAAPGGAGNSTPNATPTPAIVVEVARDWQSPADDGLSN